MNAQQAVVAALRHKTIIPAFNIPYLPMVEPVVQAIIDENSVAMVQVARLEWEKFESQSPEAVAKEYMYRYNPAVEYAREVVKSGKLGTVYSVEAQMNGLHSAEKRQWMDSFPGGMQFFLGCHLIDLIVQLQGIPSEIIPCNKETGFDGVTATDFGMTVFKYPNGISFAKACDAEPGGFARRQLVVCGEKGTLEIRPMEKYIVPAPDEKNMYTAIREVYYDKAAKLGWNYDGEYRQLDPFNRYDHMTRSLASYIRGEAKNPWTYDYEIALHEIISRACGTL